MESRSPNSNTPSPSAAQWLRENFGWTDRGGPPLAIEWDTFEQKSGRTWVRDKEGKRWAQAEILTAYARSVIRGLAEEAELEARQLLSQYGTGERIPIHVQHNHGFLTQFAVRLRSKGVER